MALLGEYLNTYQRSNPVQGLLQGLQVGSQFMASLQQQKLAQQQMDQQKEEKRVQDAIRKANILMDAYGKVSSPSMKNEIGQQYFNVMSEIVPELKGAKFSHDESADQYMSKLRKATKTMVDNPDLGIKDWQAIMDDASNAYENKQIDKAKYDEIVKAGGEAKKSAASEVGGLAIYPEQFSDEKAYSTPEARSGVEGYQKKLLSQSMTLDPSVAKEISKDLKESKSESFKPPQPWGFMTAPDGQQKAVGFDPTTRKVVAYSMPFDGQLTPFTLGRTPAAEIKSGTMLDTLKNNVDRIKQNYKKEYVGFVKGRAKQLQANVAGGVPEDQTTFYADVNDIADMLLRARSGAQINEQEYQRLSKLVPTPNLPPDTFSSRLKRFEEQLNQTMQNQQGRLAQGGYMSPKGLAGVKPTTQSKSNNDDMAGFWKK